MMTRQEALKKISQELKAAGIESAEYESRCLLEWILHIDRAEYYMHPEAAVSPSEEERLQAVCAMRKERRPLQYIMGNADFMGFTFHVDDRVLIPRMDTECLCELAVSLIGEAPARVLDLCCGSGCIGLSVAGLCAGAQVTLSDISRDALAVAGENARALGLEVRFAESDLWEGLQGTSYDYILSNPPYIPRKEIPGLMPEVRDYEPLLALDGREDGLYFYRKILEEAAEHLNPGGSILLEIGADQGKAVSRYMKDRGFCRVEVKKDLAGLDRIVLGVK